jgi:hypothetical protein
VLLLQKENYIFEKGFFSGNFYGYNGPRTNTARIALLKNLFDDEDSSVDFTQKLVVFKEGALKLEKFPGVNTSRNDTVDTVRVAVLAADLAILGRIGLGLAINEDPAKTLESVVSSSVSVAEKFVQQALPFSTTLLFDKVTSAIKGRNWFSW